MDETQYDDPEEFIPERFLNNNKFGTKQGTPVDEDHRRVTYAFGAGRRQCAGVHVAENSMVSLSPSLLLTLSGNVCMHCSPR